MVRGPQKTMFPSVWCANTQIQIYKYANTIFFQSIQKYSKYFWKGNGTRTSKTKFRFVWHANTNTQKHKYTNTALVKVTDMPNICYIFRKEMVRGHQKQCSQLSDMQIQIHKNTNTQIQIRSKFQIGLTWLIFLKK